MRKVKIAATQMACSADIDANIANAEKLVRQAAAEGTQIILLQELFEDLYFCQEEKPEYIEKAVPTEKNRAKSHLNDG